MILVFLAHCTNIYGLSAVSTHFDCIIGQVSSGVGRVKGLDIAGPSRILIRPIESRHAISGLLPSGSMIPMQKRRGRCTDQV